MAAEERSWLYAANLKAGALLHAVSFRPYAGTLTLIALCALLYLPGIATLPVTDRDEARFAQSSRQMVESGDYVNINFQDAPRYKKPIGIYWLQAASTAAAQEAGAGSDDIWAYRIPSFLGALGAVLLTFWAARPLVGRQPALIAAALFASCFGLVFEAHIAKSDAALIFSIVLMQGALFRLYLAPAGSPTRGLAALFWLGLGAGVLIKGPVAPGLAALTAAVVLLRDKRRGWLKNLHWRWGAPLMLAVTLPWFIAIGVASKGEFFKSSLGQDFAGKLRGGQESHWGPPGLYFLLFWWTFWPAALFVTAGSVRALWRARRQRRALFLLSWIAPFWLLIEAIPTKLPHYALPLYPAIAIAAAFMLSKEAVGASEPKWARYATILWGGVAALQIAFILCASWLFEADIGIPLVILLLGSGGLAGIAIASRRRSYLNLTAAAAVAAALLLYVAVFRFALPGLQPVWISENIAAAARALKTCGAGPVALAGYSEPSAVFRNGTKTEMNAAGWGADSLAEGSASLAFVTWARQGEFEQRFTQLTGGAPRPLGCADGMNINGRGPTRLLIYARPDTQGRPGCEPVAETRCEDRTRIRWRRLLNAKF